MIIPNQDKWPTVPPDVSISVGLIHSSVHIPTLLILAVAQRAGLDKGTEPVSSCVEAVYFMQNPPPITDARDSRSTTYWRESLRCQGILEWRHLWEALVEQVREKAEIPPERAFILEIQDGGILITAETRQNIANALALLHTPGKICFRFINP